MNVGIGISKTTKVVKKGGLHPQPPQPCRGTGVSDGALSVPFKRFSSKFVSPERRETKSNSSDNSSGNSPLIFFHFMEFIGFYFGAATLIYGGGQFDLDVWKLFGG